MLLSLFEGDRKVAATYNLNLINPIQQNDDSKNKRNEEKTSPCPPAQTFLAFKGPYQFNQEKQNRNCQKKNDKIIPDHKYIIYHQFMQSPNS